MDREQLRNLDTALRLMAVLGVGSKEKTTRSASSPGSVPHHYFSTPPSPSPAEPPVNGDINLHGSWGSRPSAKNEKITSDWVHLEGGEPQHPLPPHEGAQGPPSASPRYSAWPQSAPPSYQQYPPGAPIPGHYPYAPPSPSPSPHAQPYASSLAPPPIVYGNPYSSIPPSAAPPQQMYPVAAPPRYPSPQHAAYAYAHPPMQYNPSQPPSSLPSNYAQLTASAPSPHSHAPLPSYASLASQAPSPSAIYTHTALAQQPPPSGHSSVKLSSSPSPATQYLQAPAPSPASRSSYGNLLSHSAPAVSDAGYLNSFDLANFVRSAGIADADAAPFLTRAAAEGCTDIDIALALTNEELQGLGLVKLGDRKRFLALAQSARQAGEAKETKTERKDRSMFLDPQEVVVTGKPLGEGHFAVVYAGTFHKAKVAIKFLLQAEHNELAFQQEARTLQELTEHGHPNVIRFFGLCMMEAPQRAPALIMEFLSNGSLKAFLEHRGARLQRFQLLHFAKSTAAGMLHLASLSPPILHRDLAARNLLVGDQDSSGNFALRVADFGLARSASNASGEYRILNSPSPTRWTAPEVWQTGQYSVAADVWSFGVALWEIFSLGQRPYGDMSDAEVLPFLQSGKRLLQAPLALKDPIAEDVYRLMEECWSSDPSKRPSFNLLYLQLEELETVERRRSLA